MSYNAGLFVVRARAPWEPRRSFHPCRRGEPCTLPTTGHRPSGRAYLARKTTLPANRTRPRTTRLRGLIGCQLRRTFWISSCPSWQHSLVGGKIFERRGVRLDERVVTNRRSWVVLSFLGCVNSTRDLSRQKVLSPSWSASAVRRRRHLATLFRSAMADAGPLDLCEALRRLENPD